MYFAFNGAHLNASATKLFKVEAVWGRTSGRSTLHANVGCRNSENVERLARQTPCVAATVAVPSPISSYGWGCFYQPPGCG